MKRHIIRTRNELLYIIIVFTEAEFVYLVTVEPEDEGGLLVSVVDLARQVEHAADVDKHLAVAQDPGRGHCKGKQTVSFVLVQSKATKLSEFERQP